MSEILAKNLLLTGSPGCGKTTVIRRLVERLANRRVAGFCTQEIRLKGQRVGFEVRGLNGGHGTLAHVGYQSSRRVGRYGVDLNRLARFQEIQTPPPPFGRRLQGDGPFWESRNPI